MYLLAKALIGIDGNTTQLSSLFPLLKHTYTVCNVSNENCEPERNNLCPKVLKWDRFYLSATLLAARAQSHRVELQPEVQLKW